MDFNFTPEEDVFREKVRTFLKINLPKGWGGAEFELPEELQGKQFYVQWHRKLYQNGMVGMSWPKQYGGQGATQVEQAILNEELARFRAPAPLGGIGLALAGPTLIVHGNEAQKTRYLQKILSGEEIWRHSSPNPTPAPTWQPCAPGPNSRAIPSSSMARRSGPPGRGRRISEFCWPGPIPARPSTRESVI